MSDCKNLGNTKICNFLNKRDRFSSYSIVKKRFNRDEDTSIKRDAIRILKASPKRFKRDFVNIVSTTMNDGSFIGNVNVIDSSNNNFIQKCTENGCINIVG